MKPAILFFIFCLCAVTMSAQNQLEQLSVADSVLLKEVIVKADKKLVTLKSDRYVVDATSIKVGKVHLHDLLRDVPGVIQDKDHISILGKSGVKIMINGRLKNVPDNQIISLLKSYNASDAEKIEVLYVSGAEFDASGNYGILNFIMKKPKQDFIGGDVSNGITVSDYLSNETGFNLKYNRNKIVSYLNIGYNHAKNYIWKESDYFYTHTNRRNRAEERDRQNEWRARLGIDYHIDTLSTVSIEGSFSDNQGRHNATDQILSEYTDSSLSDDYQLSLSHRKLPQRYWDISLFMDRQWNEYIKTSYTIDYYNRKEDQDYLFSSDRYDAAMNLLEKQFYHFSNQENRHLKGFSSALDFLGRHASGYEMKVGLKGSFSRVTNTSRYDLSNMETQNNDFNYDEDCLATYFILSQTYWNSLDVRLGGRYEHTFTKGVSNHLQRYNKDYGRLFPDIRLSYRFKETNQLSAVYVGSIIRPWMYYLNPFRLYSNPYVANEGTPELSPSYFNKVELSYQKSFTDGMFRINGSYSLGKDQIAEVSHLSDDGFTLYKWSNAYKQTSWSLNYMLYYGILRWIKMTWMGGVSRDLSTPQNGFKGESVKAFHLYHIAQLAFVFDRKQQFTGSLFGSLSGADETPFAKRNGHGFLRGGVNYRTANNKWNIGLYVYHIVPVTTSGTYYDGKDVAVRYRDHSFRTAACFSVSYTFGKDIQEIFKMSSSSDVKNRF